MAATCDRCDRAFNTTQALQQHKRDAPGHTGTTARFNCQDCNRSFRTRKGLRDHLRNAPAHTVTPDCQDCKRSFRTDQALQQHLQNAPAHTLGPGRSEREQALNARRALQQNLRDAPAHGVWLRCDACEQSFRTEEALQQHRRDAPGHVATFNCDDCTRSFNTEQALQQHIRDSPAHDTTHVVQEFGLWPSLHQDVLRLLQPHGLSFEFFGSDDPHGVIREYDTSIMSTFTCINTACTPRRWISGQVAITIRRYPGMRYNARVYSQRCESCNSLGAQELDSSYAERVARRLTMWSGIALEEAPHSWASRGPHLSDLCEGCRQGRCRQSRL